MTNCFTSSPFPKHMPHMRLLSLGIRTYSMSAVHNSTVKNLLVSKLVLMLKYFLYCTSPVRTSSIYSRISHHRHSDSDRIPWIATICLHKKRVSFLGSQSFHLKLLCFENTNPKVNCFAPLLSLVALFVVFTQCM